MNNIELYSAIEPLVEQKYYFNRPHPMCYGEEMDRHAREMRDEIFHYMQIGEDSIKILQDKLRWLKDERERNEEKRHEEEVKTYIP